MHKVASTIARLNDSRVNIVDVGCYTGRVPKELMSLLPGKTAYSIGIDPIYHVPIYAFTHYVQVAISNCLPTEAVFYQYSDPMCSSLHKMTTNITHKYEEKDTKWFGAHDFERLLATKQVSVVPLLQVIEQYGLSDKVIHFLKIDAQGSDFDVFLSAGKYIDNCLFVQMETVTSGKPDIVLYEGQKLFENERPIIEERGFEVFEIEDYGKLGASPEADVIYINKVLAQKLLPDLVGCVNG